MKIVKMDGNVVREVIPEYALPVEKFYGPAFAAACVEAPDEVEQRWARNKDGSWSAPADIPAAAAEPTQLEQLRADVDYIAMEMGVEL